HLLASVTDITVQKKAEEEVKASQSLYQSLVDTLPLNIYRIDKEGRVTFANKTYLKTEKVALKDLLGKTTHERNPKELADKYVADDERVMREKTIIHDVEEHVLPDYSKQFVEVIKFPIFDANGEVDGVQGVYWDVTDKMEADKILQETLAKLEDSNQELEQFAYVASHDLQEPLRKVKNYTELLERRYIEQLDDKAKRYMDIVTSGATRMEILIQDLLSLSRVVTRGKEFTTVDMNKVVASATDILELKIIEEKAEIKVDELPVIKGDEGQLVQLFQNLIGNAVKFRGETDPVVEVKVQSVKDRWMISISDNGIGFDEQFAERIFVVFQRLHTRTEYQGTGIGLAVCKKIVERHGGKIWAESKQEEGATFNFTIPKN
ncbi:MAG: ATP-binding protein, partial [Draconibacterium sp.]|nr:ATP-binding protein [Draconibacterium sp.]